MVFKVAGVQMDIGFADVNGNLNRMSDKLQEAIAAGAELIVFPECTTTGYCYNSLDEAMTVAEPVDGPSTARVHEWCKEHGVWVVFGFLESSDGKLFNTLNLVGPSGRVGTYRKIHLPHLGVDRFTTTGDRPFSVVEIPQARIGMNICYDSSFPEAARCLALKGADLITLPTNWPPTSGLTADVIPNARALENHVYFMAVNRIGNERGFTFIGKSRICDPSGKTLAVADHQDEEILIATIDPAVARKKHLVNIPGEHEVHRINDRRPASYGPIVES